MNKYFAFKDTAALFVLDLVRDLKPGSALTMTIQAEKYGDCFVLIATEGSSEDTVVNSGELKFSDEHHNT